jgi:hypothetical protein
MDGNKKILSISYPGYYQENDYGNKYHYGIFWKDRKVYKK